jgi:hypothetical protein
MSVHPRRVERPAILTLHNRLYVRRLLSVTTRVTDLPKRPGQGDGSRLQDPNRRSRYPTLGSLLKIQ